MHLNVRRSDVITCRNKQRLRVPFITKEHNNHRLCSVSSQQCQFKEDAVDYGFLCDLGELADLWQTTRDNTRKGGVT